MLHSITLALIVGALSACAPPETNAHLHYSIVETVISPRHSVCLGDLIGLSPTETQQKLAGLPVGWPTPMALEVASPDGVHGFVDLHALLRDQKAGEIEVRMLSHSEGPPIWLFAMRDGICRRRGRLSR